MEGEGKDSKLGEGSGQGTSNIHQGFITRGSIVHLRSRKESGGNIGSEQMNGRL